MTDERHPISVLTPGLWAAGEWRSMVGLRHALVALLTATAVASTGLIAAFARHRAALDDFERRELVDPAPLVHATHTVDVVFVVVMYLHLVLTVAFLAWLWRAAKNAQALRRDGARLGPGWTVGAWFVPLANLVIPLLVIQSLWRATAPGTGPGTAWRSGRRSALVSCWWVTLVSSGLLLLSAGDARTIEEARANDVRQMTGIAASAVAALLAISLVASLTNRFTARRRDLSAPPRHVSGHAPDADHGRSAIITR